MTDQNAGKVLETQLMLKPNLEALLPKNFPNQGEKKRQIPTCQPAPASAAQHPRGQAVEGQGGEGQGLAQMSTKASERKPAGRAEVTTPATPGRAAGPKLPSQLLQTQ